MAETSSSSSRSRVTITLGRSGQVVKRPGTALMDTDPPPQPSPGTKRSIRDRLSFDTDNYNNNKRLRGDNGGWSSNASNCMDDLHLSKGDLRFKIMKRTQSSDQQNPRDLRDFLSRRTRSTKTNPVTSHGSHESSGRPRVPEITPEISNDRRRIPEPRDNPRRVPELRNERQSMPDPRDERQHMPERRDERQHMPERRDERQHMPERRDERQHMPERRDERQHMPERRDERQHRPERGDERQLMPERRDERQLMPQSMDDRRRIPEARDDRQRMVEPRDQRQTMPEPFEVRQRIPKLNDSRQHIPEPTNGSMTGQYTSMRTSEAPSQVDLLRSSYSTWTLDQIRRKSPDRVLNNSRGISPPQRTEEPLRRTMIREYENPRPVPYVSRDAGEISRPMATTSFLTKPPLSAMPPKSVVPLVAPSLPSVNAMQRSQYPVEPLTVEGFLRSLGLEKYLISFKVEEVDMAALSQMGDHDLKDIGIPMGPRKKILLALLARARRQAR
ncbi:sterile alpha motif domain-containing protein [Tanacetum coccineum]